MCVVWLEWKIFEQGVDDGYTLIVQQSRLCDGDDWSRRLEEESKRDPRGLYIHPVFHVGFERDHEAWQSCVCLLVTSGPVDHSCSAQNVHAYSALAYLTPLLTHVYPSSHLSSSVHPLREISNSTRKFFIQIPITIIIIITIIMTMVKETFLHLSKLIFFNKIWLK